MSLVQIIGGYWTIFGLSMITAMFAIVWLMYSSKDRKEYEGWRFGLIFAAMTYMVALLSILIERK